MALKQVHILDYAEPGLDKIIELRKKTNKCGTYQAVVSRQGVVADAIALLLKKENK